MPATVEVQAFHGVSPGTGIDRTNQTVRYKRADDDVQDATLPVAIPPSGVNFSFRKSFKLVTTVTPDNQISNLRFFSDGAALGTGRRILFKTATTYTQASAADETGLAGTVDVDTLTIISPSVINAGVVITNPATGQGAQDFVELQLEISAAAIVGNPTGSKATFYRFDEV